MCTYLPCMEGGHTCVTRSSLLGVAKFLRLVVECRSFDVWNAYLYILIDIWQTFEVKRARNGQERALGVLETRVFEVTFPLWNVGHFRHHVTRFIYQARQSS